jgi:nitroreductase
MFEESMGEAWRLRYGAEMPAGVPDIARFLTHRSVRDYSDRPIPRSTIEGLMAAAQSAATSSNLQLWTAISVQDSELRARVNAVAGNQKQVRDAPWFFVFVADHFRLAEAARAVGQDPNALDTNEFYTMAVVDVALAAERMVSAAESLGIGICYIGALRNDPYAIREILGLPEGTFAVFGLCLGWPSDDCTAEIKPRLKPAAVWHEEQYNRTPDVAEYLPRMSWFYEEQGMKGDVTWTMRSGRRANESSLTGREVLKAYLDEQGMDRR